MLLKLLYLFVVNLIVVTICTASFYVFLFVTINVVNFNLFVKKTVPLFKLYAAFAACLIQKLNKR